MELTHLELAWIPLVDEWFQEELAWIPLVDEWFQEELV
jgi:hypothetical protein